MKLKLRVFVPLVALAIGTIAGFLDAQSHHIGDQAAFAGIWFGAGLSVAVLVLVPTWIIGAIWNLVAARISN